MECLACKAEIPDTARFCSECGAPVAAVCTACGAANPPAARFCSECGSRLAGARTAPSAPAAPAASAERRYLSVMFCDLAGSTELSSRLDPEDFGALIRAYQDQVAELMARFGGFIARFLGDGVMAYFGWPKAGEADAEQAIRAALAAVEAISARPVHGEALSVRIGIATGLVVVGDRVDTGEAHEHTAIGETPNRAARLQGLAAPGGIVIDGATHRQTFIHVILPLSKAAIFTVIILNGVWMWNDFFIALVLTTNPNIATLPLGILNFFGVYSTEWGLIFASVVIAALPVVVLYLMMTKRFIAGLTAGSVKG